MSQVEKFTVVDEPLVFVISDTTVCQKVRESPKVIYYDDKTVTSQSNIDLND